MSSIRRKLLHYPTDSIMNNSVKIKYNFFPVRKKNHHKNLIISGIFVSIINDERCLIFVVLSININVNIHKNMLKFT